MGEEWKKRGGKERLSNNKASSRPAVKGRACLNMISTGRKPLFHDAMFGGWMEQMGGWTGIGRWDARDRRGGEEFRAFAGVSVPLSSGSEGFFGGPSENRISGVPEECSAPRTSAWAVNGLCPESQLHRCVSNDVGVVPVNIRSRVCYWMCRF
ncbi:uncharacterized protein BO72DRAFT_42491 [Aspergillus fijiensis CBS 313.89]|uniref:Uncharacterized protein n=1 Tax=Aspergillus fijiensis CBS 313.89 TaxID=1448319 RepID=A0A8G1RTS8_9EURO|nr:uncharacterized protein BO72DRAFT_42491 [Aspergillus fijiensis CBS 313.89]RAK79370.1 hypothetical protein BO72DRAFT_42491 [Aspergillus fijiensis CBS 313.89]